MPLVVGVRLPRTRVNKPISLQAFGTPLLTTRCSNNPSNRVRRPFLVV